ncbi:hypothetical protein CFIMG_006025RA [Ceratocystis fimbriata CBS 114723]|uniref:Peroxisomal membrane protein PEX14 n=1 Tax=Ceratocystis fimbriata CBS 114723 TaxID=1035309 RepID=A0A2C5X228_9PEZI|nr:hypothetical protein CFIMG_006025RA [Ceratocystis fimbriata CBS 114723]
MNPHDEHKAPQAITQPLTGTDNDTPDVASNAPVVEQDETTLLETARRFLNSDLVKDATQERKTEFLRSKGLNEEQINLLLAGDTAIEALPDNKPSEEHAAEIEVMAESKAVRQPESESSSDATIDSTEECEQSVTEDTQPSYTNPIVTYPEFFTSPPQREPLLSTRTLLNTLYAFTGLSVLVCGTSKYTVQPMIAATTDARTDLHKTASRNLDDLVRLLEKSVSHVPEGASSTTTVALAGDTMSDVDDPAELFSRDMGTQTSTPVGHSPATASTVAGSNNMIGLGLESGSSTALVSLEPVIQTQLKKIARVSDMSEDLAELGDQETGIARDLWQEMTDFEQRIENMQSSLDDNSLGIRGHYGYTVGVKKQNDEMQSARDNIRKLKGILLSSRNFPMATR